MASTPERQLFVGFIKYMQSQGRTPDTLSTYARDLTEFREFLADSELTLLSVKKAQIDGWVRRGRKHTWKDRDMDVPLAPATVKRRMSEVRTFFTWLSDLQEYRVPNPTTGLQAPKVDEGNPKPAEKADWQRLWASNLSDARRVAFGLAYFCGLRRIEVMRMGPHNVVQQVSKGRKTWWLINLQRKGEQKADTRFPLGSSVSLYEQRMPNLIGGDADTFYAALRRLLKVRNESTYLIPWTDGKAPEKWADPQGNLRQMFNDQLFEAWKQARMAPSSAATPHMFRHSFVTNMLDMGVPVHVVRVLANHKDLRTTQRYAQVAADPLADMLLEDWSPSTGSRGDADDLINLAHDRR